MRAIVSSLLVLTATTIWGCSAELFAASPATTVAAWPEGKSYSLRDFDVTISAPVLVAREKGHCWFPTLTKLPDGRLTATYQNSPDDAQAQAAGQCRFSNDRGLTWGPPRRCDVGGPTKLPLANGDVLFLPFRMDQKPGGVMSAALVVLRKGASQAVTVRGEEIVVTGLPRLGKMSVGPGGVLMAGFYFDHSAVRLRDGTWMATLYGTFEGANRYSVVAVKSADGTKWKFHSLIADETCKLPGEEGPCEADVCRLKDGRLMCVFRLASGPRYGQTWSTDEGKTWTEPIAMPAHSVWPSLAVMDDGTVALSGGRVGIFLWLNADGSGKNWEQVDLQAHHDACRPAEPIKSSGTTAYTQLVPVDPAHLVLIYDRCPFGWKGVPKDSPESDSVWVVRVTLKRKTAPVIAADVVKVRMEEPVLIDQASPTVKEWGPYRMPKVYRMPGGELCLTFQVGRDHYCDQGIASPMFVSRDKGATWQRSQWPHPGFTGINPVLSPVLDGEYLSIPAVKGIELDLGRLPKPICTIDICAGFPLRRLADCPEDVVRWFHDIKAVRWSPKTKAWTQEQVRWDHRGQLIETYNDTPQKIPGDWSQKVYFESPIVRCGKELLHADYWTMYESRSGQAPLAWQASLMVSTDNGRSWTRRSNIATMPARDSLAEPVIELNQAGELVCVTRREKDQRNPSMFLMHSKDRGYTWTERQELFDFGVFPRLLQLENGVLVLSFGRPGVWLSFSLDGGHSWTQKQAVLTGPSCGYTSLLALGKDTFLLAYSDFERPNAKGQPAKAILVRKISVNTTK